MSGLALLSDGAVGMLVAAFVAWVWLRSEYLSWIDRNLWWFLPPLVFVSFMFSIYCFGTILWRGIGLHTEVS